MKAMKQGLLLPVHGAGDKNSSLLMVIAAEIFTGWMGKVCHIWVYEQHEADAIVIESNRGGDMVEETSRKCRVQRSYHPRSRQQR